MTSTMVEVNENRRWALTGPFSAATLDRVTPEVAVALTRPVVLGTGLAALALVAWTWPWVGLLMSVVHEGGHMAVGLVTGLRVRHFKIHSGFSAATSFGVPMPWGPARILMTIAGYATPPLVGLGGAVLLARGKAWPLLWTAVILLVLAWVKAREDRAVSVVVLGAAGLGYVAIYGPPLLAAVLAATIVWLLLIGGVRDAVVQDLGQGSDAAHLAHDTLIPRIAWKAGFVVVALVCLVQGGERLLGI